MAVRAITHVDILRGRPTEFTVMGSAAELLALQNIKDGEVKVSEEIKESTYEVEDSTEILEQQGRKCTIEFTFSELVSADITAVSAGDEIVIGTTAGGANSTGKTLTMSSCDKVTAMIEDLKTKIVAVKTTSAIATLPYTIADNAV